MSSFGPSSSARAAVVVIALAACAANALLAQEKPAEKPAEKPVEKPVQPAAAGTLKPVAPDALLVWLYGGTGSIEAWFASPSNAAPAIIASAARSANHVVPAKAITVTEAVRPENAPDGLVLYTISVSSPEFRPGVEYTASLLTSKQPPIPLRIQETGAPQFTVTPAAITHAWRVFQEPCSTLTITNTGNTPIKSLTTALTAATPAGLALSQVEAATELAAPIAVGKSAAVRICPPIPKVAGAYAGSLAIRANNGDPKSTAITITARGPALGLAPGLAIPFVLFVVVLRLGLSLSTILDDWQKGGLQRTESAITLGTIAADVRRSRDDLDALGPGTIPGTVQRLELAAAEARALMDGSLSIGNLDAAIARLSTMRTGAQWTALTLKAINNNAFVTRALATLEKTPLPVDQAGLSSFQAAITGAMQPAAVGPNANAPPAPPPLTVEDLKERRDRMAKLQRWLLWGTSAMAAYSLFYVNNPSFGTLLDYFAVFAWALAFTEGGSQLLSRARWPSK